MAQAFILGEEFIGNDTAALVLGDNIFYGQSFSGTLKHVAEDIDKNGGATVFGYQVKDPQRFGIAEIDENGKVISLEEKPKEPKSNYAVPGLYFYNNDVVKIAQQIEPSARGEIEITAVNNAYLAKKSLSVIPLGRGLAWLDTGTYDGLIEASNFIATVERRQGLYVGCIEEIAYLNGWIQKSDLLRMAAEYKTDYGDYLKYITEKR